MSVPDSLREEACRKYKSKRLREAYIFLKSLSFEDSNEKNDLFVENTIPVVQEPAANVDLIEPVPDIEANESITPLVSEVSGNLFHTKRPPLLQSISITAAANIDDEVHLQKFHSDIEAPDQASVRSRQWMRSKSTIETSRELLNRITRISSTSRLRQLQKEAYGKRLVLTSSHRVPYQMFSIIPYRNKGTSMHPDKQATAPLHTVTMKSVSFIDDVDIGDGKREVSYSHLLVPEAWKKQSSRQDGQVDVDFDTHTTHHLVEYDPLALDDPELTCGRHRKVLNLPSLMVSIIPYTKPSEVKKDINERFKEKFPHVTITLTKLRSIKSEILQVSTKMSLDAAVIASAFVYFEKTILKTKINKENRKYIAAACLLLSIKFFDDTNGKDIRPCIEIIKDQFRLSHKDLLSCELQVLILLEFALQIPHQEVLPVLKRLETTIS